MTATEIQKQLDEAELSSDQRCVLQVALQLSRVADGQQNTVDPLRDIYYQLKRIGDLAERIAVALESKAP